MSRIAAGSLQAANRASRVHLRTVFNKEHAYCEEMLTQERHMEALKRCHQMVQDCQVYEAQFSKMRAEAMRCLYEDCGWSLHELAKEVGLVRQRVRAILRAHEVALRRE